MQASTSPAIFSARGTDRSFCGLGLVALRDPPGMEGKPPAYA